jgi:hypothetical protein
MAANFWERFLTGSGYECRQVSWEDCQRSVGSSVGPNIADVHLVAGPNGERKLWTVRKENWNETVGIVSTDNVYVVVGNHEANGTQRSSISLTQYLEQAGIYGAYANLPANTNLSLKPGDDTVSIRFQTVFLSREDAKQFTTRVYSYGTYSDDNPQNVLALCTPQGTSITSNTAQCSKLFYHAVDGAGAVHRYWLEGEKSDIRVGASQVESEAAQQAAAARGKAVAVKIGTPAMDKRFNVQLLVQVPLTMKPAPMPRCKGLATFGTAKPAYFGSFGGGAPKDDSSDEDMGGPDWDSFPAERKTRAPAASASYAARVSYGPEYEGPATFKGLPSKNYERNPHQKITITATMYYAMEGECPTGDDVRAALQDLDNLYKSCTYSGKLFSAPIASAGITTTATNASWAPPKMTYG